MPRTARILFFLSLFLHALLGGVGHAALPTTSNLSLRWGSGPVVYLGRSNSSYCYLVRNKQIVSDLSSITRVKLRVGSVEIDSAAEPNAFDWTTYSDSAARDVLAFSLGTFALTEGQQAGRLYVYSSDAPNGLAWDTAINLYVMSGETDALSGPSEVSEFVAFRATLAANTAGDGAALVGISDAAGNFAATDVEGALAEIRADLTDPSAGNGVDLVADAARVFDIAAHGATGGADDTVAIQAADTAAAISGGVVWIPEGTWRAQNIQPSSGVTYTGPGTLKLPTAATSGTPLFLLASVSGVRIVGLRLDGDRANNAAVAGLAAIQASGATSCEIVRNKITGFTQHCINLNDASTDNIVAMNDLLDYGTGSIGFGVVMIRGSSRNRVFGNYIYSTLTNTGIAIDDWSTSGNSVSSEANQVFANTIRGGKIGIAVEGSHKNAVFTNYLYDQVGVSVGDPGRSIVISEGSAGDNARTDLTPIGNTIDDNRIFNPDARGIYAIGHDTGITNNRIFDAGKYGIWLRGGTRNLIDRNRIYGAGEDAIYCNSDSESLQTTSIADNRIHDAGYRGIYLALGAASVLHTYITGNRLINVSTAASGTYDGIEVAGAVQRTYVEDNTLTDTSGTPTSKNLLKVDATATNTVRGNNRVLYHASGLGVEAATADVGTPRTLTATATWNPPSLGAGSVANTTITVNGAEAGDPVAVSLSSVGTTDYLLAGHVQATGTVRVVLHNVTGGVSDLASGTLRVDVMKH